MARKGPKKPKGGGGGQQQPGGLVSEATRVRIGKILEEFMPRMPKVKNSETVVPPALGASMYAIACILSYDGLSSISPDDDAFDSQEAKLEAANRNKSAAGKKGFEYITPGPFLRSLMSDLTRVTSSDSHKFRGSMPNGPEEVPTSKTWEQDTGSATW